MLNNLLQQQIEEANRIKNLIIQMEITLTEINKNILELEFAIKLLKE